MRVQGIRKAYRGETVLSVDELTIERPRIYAVVGANGSGKSTLGRIIAGTLKPDAGAVMRDMRVGYAPQRAYAFYGTLLRNVLLGVPEARRSDAARKAALDRIERLGLTRLANKRARTLSGGETARMALARVFVGDYDALVLDEPTAALDIESTMAAERQIVEYRDERQAAVVLITHSVRQAMRVADEALFLERGRIVERGPARDMLTSPKTDELARFLEVLGS